MAQADLCIYNRFLAEVLDSTVMEIRFRFLPAQDLSIDL